MSRLKKYTDQVVTRTSRVTKSRLKAMAAERGKHPSDLVRECIECFLREEECLLRKPTNRRER